MEHMEESEQSEDEKERLHWLTVMRTFLHYVDFYQVELERRQTHLNRLPNKYMDRLPEQSFDKIAALQSASQTNQTFLEDMVHFHFRNCFDTKGDTSDLPSKRKGPEIQSLQQHRNQAVIHSVWREWSAEAAKERTDSFAVMVNELKRYLPVTKKNAFKQRVLVPGCGVGRLPLEVAASGYSCEGNEYSAFMAIASNFMLNGVTEAKAYDIFPWLSNLSNIFKISDTITSCTVPDIAAIDLLDSFSLAQLNEQVDNNVKNDGEALPVPPSPSSESFPRFSMSAGNFVELSGNGSHDGQWDSVLTCFFMDTAPVVLEYIDVIHRALKPGGVWINLGPLLYHWANDAEDNQDPRYEQSLELSYEELKHVICTYGFDYLEERRQECTYTTCKDSMMYTVYNAVLFVVRKPLDATVGQEAGGGIVCGECVSNKA